ncbi:hypothetical protein ACFL0T_00760 [Candidatus Omnitrophota bacterium]
MVDFTKAEKKELKKLTGLAYERELKSALDDLNEKFKNWKLGGMTPFDLTDEIHNFHNGISRDLWKFYNMWEAHVAVARALAQGILERKEMKDAIFQKTEKLMHSFF